MPSKTELIIVFAGYRDWALAIFEGLHTTCPSTTFVPATSSERLSFLIDRINPDAVFLAGWSWILDKEEVEKQPIYGLHPSDLPAYSGGSPIQHQIIDGLTASKVSIFRLTPGLDDGPIVFKEDLSLAGHIGEIFGRITTCGVHLFTRIVEIYPDVPEEPQSAARQAPRKRLQPDSSRLDKASLADMSCRNLYNLLRAREDPYPNVFLEDETGRLYFKLAELHENDIAEQ